MVVGEVAGEKLASRGLASSDEPAQRLNFSLHWRGLKALSIVAAVS